MALDQQHGLGECALHWDKLKDTGFWAVDVDVLRVERTTPDQHHWRHCEATKASQPISGAW